MTRIGRRTVLQMLAGIPLLGRGISAFQSLPEDEVDRRNLAVQVLRMVNTAELWHKLEFGSYVDLTQLMTSPALKKLRSDPKAERANMGATLLSEVFLDAPEVFPGWELCLWPRTLDAADGGGNAYTAVVRETSGESRYAFASDDSGRIYEGSAAWGSVYYSEPRNVQDLLHSAMPMGSGPEGAPPMRRALGWLMKQAAFLNVATLGLLCCCPCGPTLCAWCDTSCSCSSSGFGNCFNCGCGECPWICCAVYIE